MAGWSSNNATGTGSSSSGSPAWWVSRCSTVIDALPSAANSGQRSATGAETSTSPRSASCSRTVAVTALVHEYANTGVSCSQRRPVRPSATPSHRSTTSSPFW